MSLSVLAVMSVNRRSKKPFESTVISINRHPKMIRHPGAGRDPSSKFRRPPRWTPACAGVTAHGWADP
jgi:hypothetical protein